MNARRWFVPSLTTTLWLAVFLGLVLTNWRVVLISADGDPCLHRRIGDWMIEHRQIIRTEPFSHTRPGAPLISKEWLSEVLFSLATTALDWNGLVLVAAGLIATTLGLLHRQVLRRRTDLLLATAVVLLAAHASASHWLARPHLFTHLLVVLLCGWLRDLEDGNLPARRLWLLAPVTMMVWANLHGAFFTGFILIGIFLLAAAWDRQWPRATTLAGILALSVAASLVNPNGGRLHLQIIGFLRTPELTAMVNEFRSPNFHGGGPRGLLLMFLVLAATLMMAPRRLRASEWLLIAVWGYFALYSARNGPIFALVTAPVMARLLQDVVAAQPPGRWINLYRRLNARVGDLHAAAGGGALTALAMGAMICVAGATTALPTQIFEERHPVAAVRWLRDNPDAVSGEMFNDYGWGGYLLWALPQRKVFMDGRNDFYGRDVVNDFNAVDDLTPDWETVLERYRVGWTILPRQHPLNSLLALHTGWQLLYTDKVAVIYGRREGPAPAATTGPNGPATGNHGLTADAP